MKYLFRFISKAVTLLTVIDSFGIIEKEVTGRNIFTKKKLAMPLQVSHSEMQSHLKCD